MKCVCTAKERGRDMERGRRGGRKRRAIEWNDFLMRCHCWWGRHKVLTENTCAKLIEINTKHTHTHTFAMCEWRSKPNARLWRHSITLSQIFIPTHNTYYAIFFSFPCRKHTTVHAKRTSPTPFHSSVHFFLFPSALCQFQLFATSVCTVCLCRVAKLPCLTLK